MSEAIHSVIVNGYVGKELTLCFLNKMLIAKGFKVLYLRLDNSGYIKDVYVNDELIKHTLLKEDEVIFDEIDLVCDVYKKYKCDILLTKSSKYNTYFNPVVYGIAKYNREKILELQNNKFLCKKVPTVSAMQVNDVMSIIHTICDVIKAPLFISEHYHYSFIKYNTGLPIDYSYLSFILAVNLSEIVDNILTNKQHYLLSYNKVKLYGLSLLKYKLPKTLPSNIAINEPYYTHIQSKGNVDFYCDIGKTANVIDDIMAWYSKDLNKEITKICIFGASVSDELIDIIDVICKIKFETIYIANYDEIGYSYENLTQMQKTSSIELTDWTETIFKAFSNIVYQNIVIDKLASIIDWNMKYTALHCDRKFRVLCIGNKRMMDEIKLELNKY